jgi:hypothetical protein
VKDALYQTQMAFGEKFTKIAKEQVRPRPLLCPRKLGGRLGPPPRPSYERPPYKRVVTP